MEVISAFGNDSFDDQAAVANHHRFRARGVFAVKVAGPTGSGKSTLLTTLAQTHRAALAPCLVLSDKHCEVDKKRLAAVNLPVAFLAPCRNRPVSAATVAAVMNDNFPPTDATLFIEVASELAPTPTRDLGEHLRMAVVDASQCNNAVACEPETFRGVQILTISKFDRVDRSRFDLSRTRERLRRLSPAATVFAVSARTGEGVTELAAKILSLRWSQQATA